MPRPHLIDRLLKLAAAALAGACVAALLGRAGWVTELFTHFRLQYLGLGVPLLVVLGIRRRWLWCLGLGIALGTAAVPLMDYRPQLAAAARAAPATPEFKLMTVNLFAGNRDHAALIARVGEARPDVLVLTEVTPRWAQAIEALFDRYPYRLLEPRRGGYGIALLSQSPLRRAEIVDLAGMPAVDVELVHGGQTLRLLGVHLRSPPGAARFAQRRQQYSGLTELLQARPQPTIVTGDFNTTPFSPLLTDWLRDNRVRDAARGRGYLYTWPTFLPILGIPIDHCFVTQEFQVLAHDRLPAIGSDHYPLLTRLSLTNGH